MEPLTVLSFLLLGLRVAADVGPYRDHEVFQNSFPDKPDQHFRTSNLVSSVFQLNVFDPNDQRVDQQSHLFLNADHNGHSGPYIFSAKDMSLVWAYRGPGHSTSVQVGTLYGEPVVTTVAPDHDKAVMVFNQRYELIYTVLPAGRFKGRSADPHEGFITEDDTVVFTIGDTLQHDMTAYGGSDNQTVRDGYVQEVDPKTGDLIFEWSALEHFNISDTYHFQAHDMSDGGSTDFSDIQDFAHINSVQKTPGGDFLVSGRHLWTIWLIDGKTGALKWVLGGKRNQFKDISEDGNAEFHWQHHAHMVAENRITLFDNHDLHNGFCNTGNDHACSRGLELELDLDAMTVKKVGEWFHPQEITSATRGGVQRLPNGNTLVAWGQNPMYTEHTPDGTVVMDIQRGEVLAIEHGIVGIVAYRAFKGDWVGMPQWGPNISAALEDGEMTVHVSWNGATEVDKYLLMMSDNGESLVTFDDHATESPRTGFETVITTKGEGAFARVAALDSSGHTIGVTPVVNVATGELTIDKFYRSLHTGGPNGASMPEEDEQPDDSHSSTAKWVIGIAACAMLAVLILTAYLVSRFPRFKEWWNAKAWNRRALFDWHRGWRRVPNEEEEGGGEDTEKLLAADDELRP